MHSTICQTVCLITCIADTPSQTVLFLTSSDLPPPPPPPPDPQPLHAQSAGAA